jgi:hypothetical protein
MSRRVDILRNLFGHLTSGIIRLAVAAGVLILTYLFIVKPVLNTANETFDKAFKSTGLDEIGKTIEGVNKQVQREVRQSFRTTRNRGGDPDRLIRCIKRAHGNTARIQRCTHRF